MFDPVAAIRGRTTRGLSFVARSYGVAFATHDLIDGSKPLAIEYMLEEAVIGDVPRKEGLRRYGLNNVQVAGSHLIETRRRIRLPMRFELPGSDVVDLYRVRDYSQRVRAMTAQRTCVVTAYADTRDSEKSLEMLCAMLSIAHGSMVNWVWKEYLRNGRVVATVLAGDRISRPYAGLPLMRVSYPGVLPSFVAGIATGFESVFATYELGTVIRVLSQARHGRYADLEARGMLLVALLELLALKFAETEGRKRRMPTDEFRAIAKELVSGLGAVWNREPIAAETLRAPVERWIKGDLNRTSFREKLLAMATMLQVPHRTATIGQDLSAIRDTRDSLVHRGRFEGSGKQGAREFFELLSFVDVLILRLVGHRGSYITYKDGAFVDAEL